MTWLAMLVPLLLAGISLYATLKKVDIYAAFLQGAGEGLQMMLRLLPTLICLLTATSMLRASGAFDYLGNLPFLDRLGIPSQLLPLMLLRPFSGSAALSIGADILETYGADSLLGRTASVMLGSTETTFYTVAVYFGASRITDTRYAIPVALLVDLCSFFLAIHTVAWFFPES